MYWQKERGNFLTHLIQSTVNVEQVEMSCDEAAVAVVFAWPLTQCEPHLFLIKRTIRQTDPWSGHVSFPGGRKNYNDQSLLQTSIRETFEEIGVNLSDEAQFVGALKEVIRHNERLSKTIKVSPYLFFLESEVNFKLDFQEVEKVVRVPLSYLLNKKFQVKFFPLSSCFLIDRLNGWESILYQGEVIWGITFEVLSALIQDLKGSLKIINV